MNPSPERDLQSMATTAASATAPATPAPRSRRIYTPQEKAEYVALFEQSGMTQAAFCREMSLNEATFSPWRRTAREEPSVAAPQFAEVQLRAPATGEPTAALVTMHLPGGAKLAVDAATDGVWHGLGLLLKTLQA